MQEHSHPDVLHKSLYIPFVWLTLISALSSHADVKHKPAMIVYDSHVMVCVFQCTRVHSGSDMSILNPSCDVEHLLVRQYRR